MSMLGDETGGGFDMNALLQQAQAMQEQFQRAQDDLATKVITGSAGGDLVTVEMSGTGELQKVAIKPEACDPDDTETLSALIIAAFRSAKAQADAAMAAAMPEMPQIPGM